LVLWAVGCPYLHTCFAAIQRGKTPLTRALHLQVPKTQRTVKSTDGSVTLYLDEECRLLIKPKSVEYPFPLDVQAVLALANVLKIYYPDIVEASKPFTGEKPRGFPERWT
jgi:hypothetical protein